MELKKLPKEVSSLLRTGVTITSTSQCVVELVTNALDAGATSVAVRVDFRTYKIQVIDNGCGIRKKNLDLIGKRYMTSKCHSLSELEGNLDKFGYRGEAIASLREVSGLLNITSRAEGSSSTYSKVFAHGKSTAVGLTADQRPSHGTTITVQDFLYNMPVRKKRIQENVDLEEMKIQLEALALIHHKVSFSLKNDANGKLILQTRKGHNTVDAFRNLYGIKVASCLRPIEFSEKNIKITGFFGKEVHHQKTLQFLFINNRLIIKTKIHKLINLILSKSFLLKAPGPWLNLPIPKDMNERFGIPMPKKSKHGIFVINIICPYTEYDITLDPRKTSIQFKNWDQVLQCVEEGVKSFLQEENLTVVTPEKSDEPPAAEIDVLGEMDQLEKEDALSCEEGEEDNTRGKKRKHNPTPQLHIARAVHGLPAKRNKKMEASVSKDIMQEEIASSPISDAQCNSDEAEIISENSDSPSPNVVHNTRTTQNKKSKLLSDDSTDELDSPVNTWAKFKSREKEKHNKRLSKQTELTIKSTLPSTLNKLKIYTMAASTLKKTFAHHNENEQTVIDKPATFFPVNSEEPWLDDTGITEIFPAPHKSEHSNQKKVPQSTNTNTKLIKNSLAPQSSNNTQGESIVFHQQSTKESYLNCNETLAKLPNNNISEQSMSSCDNIPQPPPTQIHPLLNFQNMARVPENHQYNHIILMQKHSAPSPHDNKNYNTSSCITAFLSKKNEVETLSFNENHRRETGYEEYDISSHSTEERSYNERKKEESELLWPATNRVSNQSPTCLMDNFESPTSLQEDLLSSDSLSDGQYEKFEARLREPLEKISREINETRHSMLRSLSPSPELESPKLVHDMFDIIKSPRSIECEDKQDIHSQQTSSHSDHKFQSLSAFAFDKSSKLVKYKPSSQETSTISKCDRRDEILSLSSDTPFTKLSKQISNIERLAEKKLVESGETPTMSHILERQRLAGLNASYTTGTRMPYLSQNIQMLNQQDSCVLTDSTEDLLSSTRALNQLRPSEVDDEEVSLQNEDLLSATAVLQQLDTTRNKTELSFPASNEYLLCTSSLLQQIGLPPATTNKQVTMSKQVLASQHLLSPSAVLQQLVPQESITSEEDNDKETSQHYMLESYEEIVSKKFDNSYSLPLTPDVETDAQTLMFEASHHLIEKNSNLKELDTPVNNSNIFLVPYSASSGSEDMESGPPWRSICDAPDVPEDPIECDLHFESTPLHSREVTNTCDPSPLASCVVSETQSSSYWQASSQKQSDTSNKSQCENNSLEKSPHSYSVSSPTSSDVEKLEWQEKVDPNGTHYYVNIKSGVTSYEAPGTQSGESSFLMTPRIGFMPKGTSPVLQLACDNQTNVLKLNLQEQQQLQHDVGVCLEDHLDTVKWTQQTCKPSGFEQLVQKLLAESASRVPETSISNACDQNEALVKVYNSLNNYKFSKDMLTSFKVLGQWDSKFVLTVVSMQSESQPHLLVMFDQHAVHERVRLERLTSGYQKDTTSCQFHGEEINPPLLLDLSEREVRVMSSFSEEFTRLGLQFSCVSDTCVRITYVPTCLKLRNERQRGSRGRSLEDLVTSLVREQAHSVLQTRGIGARVPSTLQAVLNSEACTGAIKFGDPLSDEECSLLLVCLSSCQLPFQCAHGRPVLAPVADLKHLHASKLQKEKPKLAGLMDKLLERME